MHKRSLPNSCPNYSGHKQTSSPLRQGSYLLCTAVKYGARKVPVFHSFHKPGAIWRLSLDVMDEVNVEGEPYRCTVPLSRSLRISSFGRFFVSSKTRDLLLSPLELLTCKTRGDQCRDGFGKLGLRTARNMLLVHVCCTIWQSGEWLKWPEGAWTPSAVL